MEHRLLTRTKFHHFQQPPKRMSKEVELKINGEIKKLLKAKFTRSTRYVQWSTNIVHIMKKNGKLRVCAVWDPFPGPTSFDGSEPSPKCPVITQSFKIQSLQKRFQNLGKPINIYI